MLGSRAGEKANRPPTSFTICILEPDIKKVQELTGFQLFGLGTVTSQVSVPKPKCSVEDMNPRASSYESAGGLFTFAAERIGIRWY